MPSNLAYPAHAWPAIDDIRAAAPDPWVVRGLLAGVFFWFLLQHVTHRPLLDASVQLGLFNRPLGFLGPAILVVVQLLCTIAMFQSLRPGMSCWHMLAMASAPRWHLTRAATRMGLRLLNDGLSMDLPWTARPLFARAAGVMTRTVGRTTPRTARFRSALVVAQVAASVTLFALAGLVTQTFLALMPSHPGFEARSRTAFLVYVRPRLMSNAERLQRMQDLTGLQAHYQPKAGFSTFSYSHLKA